MKRIEEIKPIVESLVFAAEEPITLRKLTDIIEGVDSVQIQEAITQLKNDYDMQGRSLISFNPKYSRNFFVVP